MEEVRVAICSVCGTAFQPRSWFSLGKSDFWMRRSVYRTLTCKK